MYEQLEGDKLICVFVTSHPQESARECGEQALGLGRCQETLGPSLNQLRAPAIVGRWMRMKLMEPHLICDGAGLVIYEDLLGDVHAVSIFEISNLLIM